MFKKAVPKINPLDFTPPSLSEAETEAVTALLLSDGWSILKKIWEDRLGSIGRGCVSTPEDQRFSQGLYQGFEEAIRTPEFLEGMAEVLEETVEDDPEGAFFKNWKHYSDEMSGNY